MPLACVNHGMPSFSRSAVERLPEPIGELVFLPTAVIGVEWTQAVAMFPHADHIENDRAAST